MELWWYVLQPEFRSCMFLFSYQMQSTNTFCIQISKQSLCPGDQHISVHGKFQLLSGFAPYSVQDKTRKPKWNDEFQFPDDVEGSVVFGPDYCFFTKEYDRVRCKLVQSYEI